MRSLVASLGLMLALAGCAGGSAKEIPPPPTAGPATFDEATGAIEGLIINEENLPLAGASVGILELPETLTVSDVAGAFTINNIAPGTYTLSAAALGYGSDGKRVDIVTGEITTVTIVLAAVALEEAFIQTDIEKGRFEVAFRIMPEVGGYAFGGDTVHEFKTDDRTDAIGGLLFEMTWQNTQALAGGMRLRAEVLGEANIADYTFCVIDSRPPGRCDGTDNVTKILENGHEDCPPEECNIQWRGFTSTQYSGLPVDFGIMVDQEYTVYSTIFYRSPLPEGYSGMPDG